jgi:hypothetical protein
METRVEEFDVENPTKGKFNYDILLKGKNMPVKMFDNNRKSNTVRNTSAISEETEYIQNRPEEFIDIKFND